MKFFSLGRLIYVFVEQICKEEIYRVLNIKKEFMLSSLTENISMI